MTTPEDFSNERFSDYLRSLCDSDAPWWKTYAFMDEIDDATWFEFELDSKTQDQPKQTEEKLGEKTLPVLQAVEDYAHEKILIVGSPGAGKSTLLTRLLWQAAQKAQQNAKAPIPILVELKLYSEAGIWELIQTSLENCNLYLEVSDIKKLVEHRRLLLLADGFNELPNDHARTKFKKFCGRKIPVIVTSRDGTDDLGLERKLQIQPLTNAKVKAFLQSRLPGYAQAQIKELSDRVKDFGQTPLMVWMLFSIFRQNGDIPTTRGEAYRAFTMLYAERAKEGIDLDESRGLLSKLAFELMHAEKPTDFRPDIGEVDAQNLLESEKALKQLVRNHLLQVKGKLGNRRISFCHQSLQEYYAAEVLLMMLRDEHPDVKDDRLQYFYLNYLKWTETIAIALSLMQDEAIAVGMVRSALEVDLILGARLAGEVYPKYSIQTTEIVLQKQGSVAPENPDWLKLKLLKKIGSKAIANYLIPFLNHPSHTIRSHTYLTLLQEAPEAIPETSQAREESNWIRQIIEDNSERLETEKAPPLDSETVMELVSEVRFIYENWISETLNCDEVIAKLVPMLQMPDSKTQLSAVQVIGSLKVEGGVSPLLQAIEDPQSSVCCSAAVMLGKIGFKSAIPKLTQIVNQHPNPSRRYWAVYALRTIGSEEVIPGILQAMQDSDVSVCRAAVKASEKFDSEETALGLLAIISHPDAQTRRLAAYNLRLLSVKENIAKLLNEQHLQTLVQALDQSDEWVRWRIVFTLWNIASEEVIPLLRPKLNHQNCIVGRSAALVLGKFGCKEAVLGLIHMMDYSNLMECPDAYEIPYTAAYALGQIKGDGAAEHLPTLINLLSTQSGQDALRAIAVIQANCQFYNYTIAQWKLAPHTTERSPTTTQYNIEHVGIFNAGDVTNQGNQKGETFNL